MKMSKRSLRTAIIVPICLLIGYIVMFHRPSLDLAETYLKPLKCFTDGQPLLNVSSEFIDKLDDERFIFRVITKRNRINGAVIVALSNYAFRETTMNWIASLVIQGYSKFVVFCYDRDLAVYLSQRGFANNVAIVPKKWLGEYTVDFTEVADWWHKSYNLDKIVKSRVYFWCELLKGGVTFLFNDLDLVYLSRHVLEHVQLVHENSRADILFQQDQNGRMAAYNTGFFYATPTKFVRKLFDELRNEIGQYTDQTGLQKLIERKDEYRESSRIQLLDHLLFSNGNMYYIKRMNEKLDTKALIYHINYLATIDQKKRALEEMDCWYMDQNGYQVC